MALKDDVVKGFFSKPSAIRGVAFNSRHEISENREKSGSPVSVNINKKIVTVKKTKKIEKDHNPVERKFNNKGRGVDSQKNNFRDESRGEKNLEIIYFFEKTLGLQKTIMNVILNKTLKRDSLNSGPISTKELSDLCKVNQSDIKVAFSRLIKKGLLVREGGFKGRVGFCCFGVSVELKKYFEKQRSLGMTF
ncbi:MAG: hypothetical protein ACKOAD_06545 [Gammaproteobacteria bacterium]